MKFVASLFVVIGGLVLSAILVGLLVGIGVETFLWVTGG